MVTLRKRKEEHFEPRQICNLQAGVYWLRCMWAFCSLESITACLITSCWGWKGGMQQSPFCFMQASVANGDLIWRVREGSIRYGGSGSWDLKQTGVFVMKHPWASPEASSSQETVSTPASLLGFIAGLQSYRGSRRWCEPSFQGSKDQPWILVSFSEGT